MAALKDIKRKIKGVQKTRQITKAMNMVAASKFKNALTRMENFRDYSGKLSSVIEDLCARLDLEAHPLLAVREPKKIRLLLLTSDRGLCGGFNNNLLKFTDQFIKKSSSEGKEVILTPLGRKGRDYFRKKMPLTDAAIDIFGNLDYSLAVNLAERLIPSFLQGECDEIYLIYNRFVNVAIQKPSLYRLLPLGLAAAKDTKTAAEYIYEPSARELLDKLLPINIHVQIYQRLLETVTGENGARMVAMDNATKNCDELSRSLTLKLNKARQAAITAELMDIVGGAEALSQG